MPDGPLLALDPRHDTGALAQAYATFQRLQIRDLLTPPSAEAIHGVLARETPWGLAWHGKDAPPEFVRNETLQRLTPADQDRMGRALRDALSGREYGFVYTAYPMLKAYLERWNPGSVHERLLEEINSPPMLDFIRAVTGIPEIVKADAQATLYAPTQFLALHDDAEAERGRRVAYVLNFCAEDWRPDWGGYLNFYDDDGDVIAGYRPRFNALNLFTVPQRHNVTYVPPFAPVGRFAITGWFRDQ